MYRNCVYLLVLCAFLRLLVLVLLAAQRVGGTLEETAAAIEAAGGKGVAVACDHADDKQASCSPTVHNNSTL